MPARKQSVNVGAVVPIDLGRILPKVTKSNVAIKRSLSGARRAVDQLRKSLDGVAATLTALEAKDTLGSFEIQDLMRQINQAHTLMSNVLKKRDDTGNAIIGKV